MGSKNDAETNQHDFLFGKKNGFSDFIADGIHFGRGSEYIDEYTSTHLTHSTTCLKCWRIVDKNLEELDEHKNHFLSSDTYIVRWNFITNILDFKTKDVLETSESELYFYWKGDTAAKGYSPLPDAIEAENPPVERLVQWAEPPVFLQLFSGSFVVNISQPIESSNEPHLYILRGEEENELHLYEVPLERKNLRSRTSFVLYFPKEERSIIWHGAQSNNHTKDSIKKITGKVFGINFFEISEDSESETFLNVLPKKSTHSVTLSKGAIDYQIRLYYFNDITGSILATEVENSHSSSFITPLPFLQSHLYTATQPATFLLDDEDVIWIWQGWEYENQNESFKSECFTKSIEYAKQKSKLRQKLVKLQKVIAGFEPNEFVNCFPNWIKRKDVVEIQEKNGVIPNINPLIEVISHNSDEAN